MEENKKYDEKKAEQSVQDALDYPGVAINDGDDEKENKELVKERTKTLNNNPRNNDL